MLQWLGLNPNLLCHIYPVDYSGTRIAGSEVVAPLVDGGTLEASFNWQSPFENAGTESKAPMLAAMLQSGAIQPVLSSLTAAASGTGTAAGNAVASGIGSLSASAKEFEGKTGITKLNSTQIFSGMPPIKLSITLVFRAFANARAEVMKPYEQLWRWALPQELARDGAIAGLIKTATSQDQKDVKDYLHALMPSRAPMLVGIQYKKRILAPMVIESISEPLDSPITETGDYARLLIPITISTLSALDKNDWVKVSSR